MYISEYYDFTTGTVFTDPKYKEILKLDTMLTESDIPHERIRLFDGWQVCYPSKDHCIMDAIEHLGSYGHESDKLEIMGLLTPKEKENDSVLGYLTAEEVFERIRKHYNGEWNDYIKEFFKPTEYSNVVDGDVYLNPLFGDLWIIKGNHFVKINDGYDIELDDVADFIKVGHVDL